MDFYIQPAEDDDEDRHVDGHDDLVRDALERARARINSLETKLADQARERAELVHLVSHELRNPITVISGFGRLLKNARHGPLTDDQAHFVEESLKACQRLDRFVVDLLEAAPDSGTPLSVEISTNDLHGLIRSQLEALAPLLDERGIEIELDLSATNSSLPFDAHRIEQVVTNLMTNAIRYGRPEGVIRIETKSRSLERRGWVEIAVEDDGPGIPVEDRERLFAPYVRGDAHRGCAGLGIGLAICRRVIASHDGEIRVESGALGGARFVFTLPCSNSSNRED
jgi:signal transduction histidine kinase